MSWIIDCFQSVHNEECVMEGVGTKTWKWMDGFGPVDDE